MTFELCVPAYNEADIIEKTLARIFAVSDVESCQEWRIIVSDNASVDGTGERARLFPDPRVSVLRVEQKGKGAAIMGAALESKSDFFGFIDADLSVDPTDITPLLTIITSGEADICIGSRLLDGRLVRRGPLRSASSRLFNWLRSGILGINVVDSQCGLKIMNARAREILCSCEETGWFLDIEFLAKAERAGLRIREVPVHWDEQSIEGRVSKLSVFRDGLGAIIAMLRIRNRIN